MALNPNQPLPVMRPGQSWMAGSRAAQMYPDASNDRRKQLWKDYAKRYAPLGTDAETVYCSAFHSAFNAELLPRKG